MWLSYTILKPFLDDVSAALPQELMCLWREGKENLLTNMLFHEPLGAHFETSLESERTQQLRYLVSPDLLNPRGEDSRTKFTVWCVQDLVYNDF